MSVSSWKYADIKAILKDAFGAEQSGCPEGGAAKSGGIWVLAINP
jgi:hypothetical protein